MMTLAALLLTAASAQPVPVDPPRDDIVVTARKLKNFRARVRERKGAPHCDIRRSSGDADFDAAMCAAMLTCNTEVERSRALAAGQEERMKRRDLEALLTAELTRCMAPFFERYGLD